MKCYKRLIFCLALCTCGSKGDGQITVEQIGPRFLEHQCVKIDSMIPTVNYEKILSVLDKNYSSRSFEQISLLYYIEQGEVISVYPIFILIDNEKAEIVLIDGNNISKRREINGDD